MLDAAHGREPARRSLPVTVRGKRIKTIDVHSHCFFHEAIALIGDEASQVVTVAVKGAKEQFIVVEERLKAMDAMAIDMEVLSINPFWYGKDRDLAGKIVDIQNEKLAELCHSKPERFAAFASLALQHPDLAVQQLEHAVKEARPQGRGDRRQRRRRRFLHGEIPSGVGESGRARRGPLHPSAEHAGAGAAIQGQRLALQHDR